MIFSEKINLKNAKLQNQLKFKIEFLLNQKQNFERRNFLEAILWRQIQLNKIQHSTVWYFYFY